MAWRRAWRWWHRWGGAVGAGCVAHHRKRASVSTAKPQRFTMKTTAQQRRNITLDLPAEQIVWLDQQAAGLMSRSAFVRQLIAAAMQDKANA